MRTFATFLLLAVATSFSHSLPKSFELEKYFEDLKKWNVLVDDNKGFFHETVSSNRKEEIVRSIETNLCLPGALSINIPGDKLTGSAFTNGEICGDIYSYNFSSGISFSWPVLSDFNKIKLGDAKLTLSQSAKILKSLSCVPASQIIKWAAIDSQNPEFIVFITIEKRGIIGIPQSIVRVHIGNLNKIESFVNSCHIMTEDNKQLMFSGKNIEINDLFEKRQATFNKQNFLVILRNSASFLKEAFFYTKIPLI